MRTKGKKSELREGSKNKPKSELSDDKPLICGHEEIVHSPICKPCHAGKAFCNLKWFRCGGHGEHVESDCQTLCV